MNHPMDGSFDREAAEALDRLAREGGPGPGFEARVASSAADVALCAWLDALGRDEAAAAPEGFEGRLLDAVAAGVAPTPIRLPASGPARLARWAGAAAAVVGVAAGLWWAAQPSGSSGPTLATQPTLAEDFGLLMELYESPAWTMDLVDLRSDADAVAEAMDAPWAEYESLSESLLDGAI